CARWAAANFDFW
nr:immunoglobulin heavy chain junction region [Macaca mulatta]MOV49063.1 immunoglobulin heavy chain junction region [Macaca mulatta]MOV49403.1 immunoglobulin heavy chain junction region [Macaca mulatta]MOV51816.1 immunoglobulin heavy chain junction region [Macaca mulatta]MOV52903.1 immunoglobulin heavy chain junction region [Macaca mulatta]